MPTDTERREVARRLRTCTPPASYTSAQGGGWSHLCDMALAVGLTRDENPSAWTLANLLADLIEPSCDRDALLALAEDVAYSAAMATAVDASKSAEMLAELLLDIARRIREACGEAVA